MATGDSTWRYLLAWSQPILIALLTGGVLFVERAGSDRVDSTDLEWQKAYANLVRQVIELEEEIERCRH